LNTDVINIVLATLLFIACVVIAVLFLMRKNAGKKAAQRVENRLKQEIRILKDDSERIKTLYENLKNNAQTPKQPLKTEKASLKEITLNAEALLIEQKKLEQDKKDFSEKNRKLWDMSLSIQKEKEYITALKNDIEKKHRTVTDSIHYARRIQVAVLPPEMILKECFSDYFLFWRPREIVSGDFYWMKHQDDIIAFTVADCTGHGVPGAFMSLFGIAFLNEICANLNENTLPSDVLEKLRKCIIDTLSQDCSEHEPQDGMDITFCILNLKTKNLRVSGANNPLYIIRNGELTEYKAVKTPVGAHPRPKDFETQEIEVSAGDYLFMFSDGFADQFSSTTKRKVTYGKFKELLTNIFKENPSGENFKKRLNEFIENWKGDFQQMDDILVGGYRI